MKSLLTCLAIPVGLISLIVLLFVGGRFYGQWRMAQMAEDLASLARELGYTPDDHLRHEIAQWDPNLVTGSAHCGVYLYFTTPLSVAKFTERLNQVWPETKDTKLADIPDTAMYTILDLTVNGVGTWKPQNASYMKRVNSYFWPPINKGGKFVRLYETMSLDATIGYKGRQVEGNIVDLHEGAGVFPFWMYCPVTFSDEPEAPFD
jgi:hypothetical protein